MSSAIAIKQNTRKKKPVKQNLRKTQAKTSLTEAVRRLVSALSTTSEPVGVFCFDGRISIYKISSKRFADYIAKRHDSFVGIYNRCFCIEHVVDDFGLFFVDEAAR